ncbi:AbrB family transcriptional regulator (plasmid) [Microcystis aeruginosa NIES-2481]|jgi:antitoxin component of MazEF toxin-antitoxin module|nr:AbrB family transcriptional regulator [Microcystis sp. LE19-8.1F]AUS35949.1 AbrB family transcriptional regulator [Microcystis aeruginosa NIES-2481]
MKIKEFKIIAMELVTLDRSRCIQIPETLLEQLGIEYDSQFQVEVQDGKLVLNPIKEEPKVYYENDVLVVDSQLLVNTEAFIEELRQERMNELML